MKIFSILPKRKRFGIDGIKTNEYSIMKDSILELEDESDAYRTRVADLERVNQAITLEHFLSNGVNTKDDYDIIEKCLNHIPEFFCVAVVRCILEDGLSINEVAILLENIISNGQYNIIAHVRSGVNDEVFVFEIDSKDQPNTEGVRKMLEEAVYELTQKQDAVFHVGISTIGTDFCNINRCYDQAYHIVQAQFASENENVVKAYDITENAAYDILVNVELLNRLFSLLISGQRQETIEELNRIEGYFERMPYLFEVRKEQIFYSIWNIFFTANV
ncbi:MAG: hypothetical protein K6E19_11385 [Lachnospiraceae bacterium]|nr:hypothetical protein [Lachnospiraceae bacterium]